MNAGVRGSGPVTDVSMVESVLDVRGLTVERAGLPIVRDVSIRVDVGTVTVLLGANGAGKTTLLEGISGVLSARAGEIRLAGERIDTRRPFERARAGLAHVEQGRAVFPGLTAAENLSVAHSAPDFDFVYGLFPELERRRDVEALQLSGGEQQMLVIARALVRKPSVLLLDEMSLGLAPAVIAKLMDSIRSLVENGISILMVEQFPALALEIGTRAYVIRRGEVVFEGACEDLRSDLSRLHDLYLGETRFAEVAR